VRFLVKFSSPASVEAEKQILINFKIKLFFMEKVNPLFQMQEILRWLFYNN